MFNLDRIPAATLAHKIAQIHGWEVASYEWKGKDLTIVVDDSPEGAKTVCEKRICELFHWKSIKSVDPENYAEIEQLSDEEKREYFENAEKASKAA